MTSDRPATPSPRSTDEGQPGASPGEAGFPHENPNRPREYHGARTVIVALLVLAAVAVPLWLTLAGGDSPSRDGDFGLATRPAYLLPADLPPGALDTDDTVGRLAPDFELETLDGNRFRLSDWAGHPVVVNFWASWCTPCRREVPVLIRLQEQHRAAGLIIVGVNIEEARRPAQDFADEFGINFALPMDFDGSVTRRYGIDGQLGPPHTMFIGPDGVIQQIFRGQGPDAVFEATVAALLDTLAEPVGPQILPGPKALPAELLATVNDSPVAASVGATAPDFVLADAINPGLRWRLSGQRGTALLLVFVRPNCTNCDDELARAVDAATAAGVRPTIIRTASTPLPTESPYTTLVWERQSAAVFGAGASVEYVLIDAAGVIEALPLDDAAAAAALAARTAPNATGDMDDPGDG
ncbi:MAG: Thiol-disulfide isomerase or thioredoxin [Chloroflexi bacterium]|nr:MAG: Thiol-disulfide isomerase or thioredoxin [Chloroflexota bacterium]